MDPNLKKTNLNCLMYYQDKTINTRGMENGLFYKWKKQKKLFENLVDLGYLLICKILEMTGIYLIL